MLTPNVAHAQIVVDAFAAGKHVLCEKPMSHSSSEAQRMIDAWKKSGKYSESMSADDALDLVAESAREAAKDMRDNLRAVLP